MQNLLYECRVFFSYIRNIHAYADTQIAPRANPRASNSAFCTLAVKIILQYYLRRCGIYDRLALLTARICHIHIGACSHRCASLVHHSDLKSRLRPQTLGKRMCLFAPKAVRTVHIYWVAEHYHADIILLDIRQKQRYQLAVAARRNGRYALCEQTGRIADRDPGALVSVVYSEYSLIH